MNPITEYCNYGEPEWNWDQLVEFVSDFNEGTVRDMPGFRNYVESATGHTNV